MEQPILPPKAYCKSTSLTFRHSAGYRYNVIPCYCFAEFHPALIGLTGSVDEIKDVARAFRVYYMKTEEEESDYLVDHSVVMYVSFNFFI